MTTFKKILSVLALIAMAGFIVSVLVLIVTGYNEMTGRVIYGFISAFLIMGLSALIINYFQKRAEEKRLAEEKAAAEAQAEGE